MQLLGFLGFILDSTGVSLPSALFMVEPFSKTLLMKLHIVVLRLNARLEDQVFGREMIGVYLPLCAAILLLFNI